MGELKEFPARGGSASGGKPTKEKLKLEKPASVFDIKETRKKIAAREAIPKTPFVFPDIGSEELMETASGLVKKLFEDSRDKKMIIERLRKLVDELEQRLRK